MDVRQKTLLRLVSCKVLSQEVEEISLAPEDWQGIYAMAVASKVDGLVYDLVAALPDSEAPPASILKEWHRQLIVRGIHQMRCDAFLRALLAEFNRCSLPFVLFKGPVLADLYHNPSLRFSVDYDLFVTVENLPRAEQILRERGYRYLEDASKNCVSTWRLNNEIYLEVHTRLAEDYKDGHAVQLEKLDLTHPDSLVSQPVYLGEVCTMNPTSHLIFQVYHIAKHIMYRGIMLRNFVDTALFINRYMEKIDAEQFWAGIEAIRYTKLCICLLEACSVYFGMDRRILPSGFALSDERAERFMEDMLDGGFVSEDNGEGDAAASFIFRTVTRARERAEDPASHRTNRLRLLLSFVFPPAKHLPGRYAYAKRLPLLLPIAWAHRGLQVLFRKQGGISFAAHSCSVMHRRTDILSTYDLLN